MDVSAIDERVREIIRRFLMELPAASDRKIAKIIQCDVKHVSQLRRALLDAGELQKFELDKEGDI